MSGAHLKSYFLRSAVLFSGACAVVGAVWGVWAAIPSAEAGKITYYYCRKADGPAFHDFVLTVTDTVIRVQPHDSPESPSIRIYDGKPIRTYGNGNVLVDFETQSYERFGIKYPNMLLAVDLIARSPKGYLRIYTSSNPKNDTIHLCEYRKIFY